MAIGRARSWARHARAHYMVSQHGRQGKTRHPTGQAALLHTPTSRSPGGSLIARSGPRAEVVASTTVHANTRPSDVPARALLPSLSNSDSRLEVVVGGVDMWMTPAGLRLEAAAAHGERGVPSMRESGGRVLDKVPGSPPLRTRAGKCIRLFTLVTRLRTGNQERGVNCSGTLPTGLLSCGPGSRRLAGAGRASGCLCRSCGGRAARSCGHARRTARRSARETGG